MANKQDRSEVGERYKSGTLKSKRKNQKSKVLGLLGATSGEGKASRGKDPPGAVKDTDSAVLFLTSTITFNSSQHSWL